MSDNPYTMNSLGPVWQKGHDSRNPEIAALRDELERAQAACAEMRKGFDKFSNDVGYGAGWENVQEVYAFVLEKLQREKAAVEAERERCISCIIPDGNPEVAIERIRSLPSPNVESAVIVVDEIIGNLQVLAGDYRGALLNLGHDKLVKEIESNHEERLAQLRGKEPHA